MSKSLDDVIIEYFQPEKLKAAFEEYEKNKTDFFNPDKIKVQMGADGISYQTFKKELDLRCQLLSNRLLKGTYQFYTFREVKVPKPSGGTRCLSIATIRDVLVQKVLYEAIYNDIEKDFQATNQLDKVSCAYRKGKSAPFAASLINRYLKQGFVFALDADIVKFFDKISHHRLIEIIKQKFGEDSLATKLLIRFIRTGGYYKYFKNKNHQTYFFQHHKPTFLKRRIIRTEGIPQGGILSGMLANLYLHEFDCWVINDLSKRYPLRYVRYADDFVILLKEQANIPLIHQEVAQKLEKNIKIDLHPIDVNDMEKGKTKYVDIEKNSLEFVGFQFTLEHIRIKSQNIQRFQTRILEKIAKEPSYNSDRLLFLIPGSLNNYQIRFRYFINGIINKKVLGRGEEICSVCNGVIGERVKSWMGFFMVVTDIQQIRDLDKWMRKEICKHFYKTYQIRLQKSDFKAVGLVTLEKEYYRLHKRKICSCEQSNCLTNPTIDSESIKVDGI